MSLFSTLLLLSPAPTEASALSAKPESVSEAKQAARGERLARRHAKLDQQLNDAVEDALNAESNVIIEFHQSLEIRSPEFRDSLFSSPVEPGPFQGVRAHFFCGSTRIHRSSIH